MYAWDTPLMKINQYDYDVETGAISNKQLLVDLEVYMSYTCGVVRE